LPLAIVVISYVGVHGNGWMLLWFTSWCPLLRCYYGCLLATAAGLLLGCCYP
jgi:ABC-type nitrate/sulfonate/bicarbonate transport system permease component